MTTPQPQPRRKSPMQKYGPLVGIAAAIALVAGVLVLSGGDEDETASTTTIGNATGLTIMTQNGAVETPEHVIPFSTAKAAGIEDEIDWGPQCDTERGTAAVPTFFAPECFAPFEGDNGGATADQGVTADSITVVLYQPPENDLILNAIVKQVADDTTKETCDTYKGFIEYFEYFYETYGREVNFICHQGKAQSEDEVAHRADAVDIAEKYKPFVVFGGPILGSAFGDELANRGIMNISFLGAEKDEYYKKRDPYLWVVGAGVAGGRLQLAEYLGKKVANRPAEHAGDPELQKKERVLGLVYVEATQSATELAEGLEKDLEKYDAELAIRVPFKDPRELPTVASTIIAKLKDAGVTSVIFAGDPLSPQGLTQEATRQNYFPEWILTGSALVDTAVFARKYDQKQWAHAFGISSLPTRQDPTTSGSYYLYEWFHGSPPPADDGIALIFPAPALFYAVLEGVGPNLTAKNFRDVLFTVDPTPRAITNPSLSWGDKGIYPFTDYFGIDDWVELWWDPEAEGPDETRKEGKGLYHYVDGGKRYLPGEWTEDESKAFVEEGSVTIYEEAPESEQFPDYESPKAKG